MSAKKFELTIYLDGPPWKIVVRAERVYLDPRIKTAIHRRAEARRHSGEILTLPWWDIAELGSGWRIGDGGKTKAEAIRVAIERLEDRGTDERIRRAIAKGINNASDIEEMLAFSP